MKTAYLFAILCITVAGMAACNNQPALPPAAAGGAGITEHGVDSTTTVLCEAATARRDIASFDSLCKANFHDDIPVQSFTVRAADLFGAMGVPYYPSDTSDDIFQHIRVYLAYRVHTGFKLYFVPVRGAHLNESDFNVGEDILLDAHAQPTQRIDAAKFGSGDLNDRFVLDLNTPCPNICDQNSPLVAAFHTR